MSWNFFDPASKDLVLRVVREQSDGFLELASRDGCWEDPTASGHWQVRDVVGHLVDTTEGYFEAFDSARADAPAPDPLGVKGMDRHADEGALRFRGTPQAELVARLREDRDKMLEILEGLSPAEWAGLLPPHKYMGQVPACIFAAGQLVDYAVHGWDIRQGAGMAHALDGDAADLLVPFCWIVWQSTAETADVEPFQIGVRMTGHNGGETRVSVSPQGIALEPGSLDDLPLVLEFDPASFVLTAMGRMNAGTARGDSKLAERYGSLFFRI